jgi:hypothetical protein
VIRDVPASTRLKRAYKKLSHIRPGTARRISTECPKVMPIGNRIARTADFIDKIGNSARGNNGRQNRSHSLETTAKPLSPQKFGIGLHATVDYRRFPSKALCREAVIS